MSEAVIDYEEIVAKADEFDIRTSNVQRDYVFGCLIAAIADDAVLADRLVLKGGNALRKGYFPATRFSDDLDYSTPDAFEQRELLARFRSVCDVAQDRSGVVFEPDRTVLAQDPQQIDGDRQVQRLRLYFRDFTGTTQEMVLKVRVDITEFDRLVLPVQNRLLIHPYSDAAAFNDVIRCVKLEEALADKLRALMQRQYSHDLFDLVYGIFVNRDLDVSRVELVRTFLAKSLFGGDAQTPRGLLLALPFDLMRGFWQRLVLPKTSRFSFEDAVAQFRNGVAQLFAPFAVAERRATGFFPAEFRAAILRGGTERTLLRMAYAGMPRLVEPYALVFKRPAGRAAREYFYGFDRTGGRSTGPGIKSFFPERIQTIENTDEPFEPRFPIELTKDAATGAGTFARPFSRGARTSASRRRRPTRPSAYRVRCPYCDKTFARTKPSTKLNPHSDGYGNRCPGRNGYLV
jgi:predicted nucleotidyltransferase component of viral defense system